MAKIQITQVSVKKITYIGDKHTCLNKNYQYVAALIEGYSESNNSQVRIEFMNCGCNIMIYDSFVAFAEDWRIDGDYKFEKCSLLPTSK
jgi:hypothetical protein